MKKFFKKIRKDKRGQTATEYMLIIAVLVLVIVGAAQIFGGSVANVIQGSLKNQVVNLLGGSGGGSN